MGRGGALGHNLAFPHMLPLEHGHMAPFGYELFVGFPVRVGNHQALLALGLLAKTHDAALFRQHRRLLGLSRLEQIRHPGQTAGDVAGLQRFLGQFGDDVPHFHLGAVVDGDDRLGGQRVMGRDVRSRYLQLLPAVVHQFDHGAHFLGVAASRLRVHDLDVDQAGYLVHPFVHCRAFHHIHKLNAARHLGYHRVRMGVPAGDPGARLNLVAFVDCQNRAIRDLVTLPLPSHFIKQGHFAGTGNHHLVAAFLRQPVDAFRLHSAAVFHFDAAHGRFPGSGAADVKGAHGQLGARLADGLGGHHADGLADVDKIPAPQVPAVALGADPVAGLAGDGGAHPHLVDAVVIHLLHRSLVQQGASLDNYLLSARLDRVLRQHPSQHPFTQGFHDVAALDERSQPDAFLIVFLLLSRNAAILFRHDHILGHIHQAPGQVAGVGGLQGRVGQTLAGAVGGNEVLSHIQPFAEVRRDGRLDDGTIRLGHQAAHPSQLPDLRRGAAGAGIGHHKDGIEGGLLHFFTLRLPLGNGLLAVGVRVDQE